MDNVESMVFKPFCHRDSESSNILASVENKFGVCNHHKDPYTWLKLIFGTLNMFLDEKNTQIINNYK